MADKNLLMGALLGAAATVVGLGASGNINVASARTFRTQARFVLSDAEKKDVAALLAAHAPDGGTCGPSVTFELVPGGLSAFVVCRQPAKVSDVIPDGATLESE